MLPLDNLYGRQPLKHNSKQICTYVLSNMRYKAPWNEETNHNHSGCKLLCLKNNKNTNLDTPAFQVDLQWSNSAFLFNHKTVSILNDYSSLRFTCGKELNRSTNPFVEFVKKSEATRCCCFSHRWFWSEY